MEITNDEKSFIEKELKDKSDLEFRTKVGHRCTYVLLIALPIFLIFLIFQSSNLAEFLSQAYYLTFLGVFLILNSHNKLHLKHLAIIEKLYEKNNKPIKPNC